MKHLRKSILTLLALTLFGGAGAWAQQGPTQVTEFTTDLIASWATDNSDITLADLQDLGFVAVDASVAQAWTGAPSGDAFLFYDFDGGIGTVKFIWFDNGNVLASNQGPFTKSDLYNEVANGYKYFYTGAPNQAIELTKAGDNQWSLGQTPDYDLELQVEYYQKYALKDIPAGWTVMVNGVPQEQPYQGDSLLITETDAVTLVPDGNRRRVKSVTLEDEVQTITIDNPYGTTTITYTPGETWRQAIANHPTENAQWSVWGTPEKAWFGETKLQSWTGEVWSLVDPDTAISSSTQYQLVF